MKYKKTMILLVLAIFIFGVASVCASDVNDTIIANEDDSIVELSVESNDNNVNILEENDNDVLKSTNDQTLSTDEETGSLVDLNHEINDNDNTTITLTKNYKYVAGDDAFQFGMDINRTLTINGNGHTIDGSGTASIFKINADHVTITNLTFKNCKAYRALDENGRPTENTVPRYEFNGGAIKWEGNYGTITQCTFTENYAVQNGGAIKWSGDYGTVKLCNFKNNTAEYFYSGAIDLMGSNATVTQSNFTGNKALNSQAGAINFNDYSNVSHCIFINNTASHNGGAISIGESNNVSYCIFIGNKALWTGGAINMYSDSIIAHSIFSNNTAEFDGGALFINDQNVLVINSTFAGNSANRGGAIYGYDNDYTKAILSIFDSNINETFDYFTIAPAYLNVNDFTTSYNSGEKLLLNLTADNVNYDGYNITIKIYNQTDDLVRTFHALSGDEWIPDLPVGYYHASFDSEYAGFQQINRTITITAPEHTFWFLNYTINGNDNPVIELSHDFYFDPAYDAAFVNGIVINRPVTIKGNGNAIDANRQARIFYVQSANAVLENLTIINANYNGDGGAIYFAQSGSAINCNFVNNSATGGGSWGGAIIMYSGTVSNCNFTDNSARYGGAVYFFSTGTVSNCNFTDNSARYGGAVYFLYSSTVLNCNFTGNTATSYGGAVYFNSDGTVTNCNFTNNTATGEYTYGGAIRFDGEGTVTNCNFTDNSAGYGGAVFFDANGEVTNCNFTGNNATTGSAICFIKLDSSDTLTVSDSTFLNNRANAGALDIVKTENNITITFTGQNNLLNAIYSREDAEVTFTNVTYWGAKGITTVSATLSGSNKAVGQNITVGVVVNGKVVLNEVNVTNENGTIVLDISAGENYYISARHVTDSYYTEAETTISNNINVNVTSKTTTNKTVNITAKSNIPNDVVQGKLLFILPNGTQIEATYGDNGTWWAVHEFDKYDVYQVNATYVGLDNVTINNGTITINKLNSTVDISDVVLTYGETKNVTVTTEGATGITAKINGNDVTVINNYTIVISGLAAGNYTLTVTTIPDGDYNPVNKTVNVTVNKAHTEITINTTSLELIVGDETIILATLFPDGAGNVTFTSSNKDIVEVDDKGNIIAQGKGQAIITVSFAGDNNYTAAENKTVTINVSLADASVTVDKSNVDLKVGETYAINATKHPDTILLDITCKSSNNAVATVDKNGIVTAVGEGTAIITVEVGDDILYAINSTNVTVTVSKIATDIASSAVTTVYNIEKNLIVTLKDADGKPISGAKITVDLNGAKTYTTDKNGQVNVSTKGLAPKAYTAKVTFNGDTNYDKSTKDIKVTVKKATPKLTAKKKTYKTTPKTKKYSIVLKDNTGKAIKKAKVTLKVKGKTYKATTNSKGKATFKITKLNKKGTFKATITYKGNKYYNKISKKAKIKVIVTFKTVSKGSKDKATVKEIQQALKDKGYYLTYQGHYLKVDGKFKGCTERSLKEFQKDNGLKVTGKVDEKTAKKLGIL